MTKNGVMGVNGEYKKSNLVDGGQKCLISNLQLPDNSSQKLKYYNSILCGVESCSRSLSLPPSYHNPLSSSFWKSD